MNSFLIKDFRVDIDRRLVFRGSECISLEPKVCKVLDYLARHSGEVVSHQTLLDAIWTNRVVEPGALQRCIALLRKVFNDDARKQEVIATYPKQGYSIVADVVWNPELHTPPSKVSFRGSRYLAAGLATLLFLAGGILILQNKLTNTASIESELISDSNSNLTNPALLEAIGNPDSFPVYSPDGRYVVYPRYLVDNKAHLWARDLAYGNDFLLTEEAGIYEHLAWSLDSSRLVFVDATCQANNCRDQSCSSLKAVAVSQSETNALMVEKLINCSEHRLLAPEWINNKQLAYIEVDDMVANLVHFDLKTGEQNHLLASEQQIPYHLSYSRQTNILTIMAINPEGQKELLFLDINSGAINKNDTAAFVPDGNFYPSSNPH